MAERLQQMLQHLVSLLMPGAFVVLASFWLAKELHAGARAGIITGLWSAAFLPVALLLAILLHEVGHVTGARLVGYRPRLFVIGPLALIQQGGRFRSEWNWRAQIAGGLVAATPPADRSLTGPVAVVMAAGPVSNILASLLSAALLQAWGPPAAPSLLLFAAVFGAASLVVAIIALNPLQGETPTDGLRLLRLLRGGPLAERDAALFALTGLIYSGIRPAKWPQRLLDQATALADSSPDEAIGHILSFYRTLDQGERHAAARHLARSLQLVDLQPAAVRQGYYLEAAYGAAVFEADAAKATTYLKRAGGGVTIEPYVRLRCEAAVLLAQGRAVQAMERIDHALALVGDREKTGTDCLEESLLQELQARANEVLAAR